MKLESTFSVPADSARVLELFLDAATMQACIPGCEELVRLDEEHFSGRLVNEIAHVRFNAAFSAEIIERDGQVVRAILRGEDRRLASSLKMEATLRVAPAGERSDVSYAIEMAMWGRLGRMGESIFRRRTAEVEKQFVAAFSQACAAAPVVASASPGRAAVMPTAAPVTIRSSSTAPAAPTAQPSAARPSVWRRLVTALKGRFGRRSQ